MPQKLIKIAEREGIIIHNSCLPKEILGVYYSVFGKPPVILLDKKILSNRPLTRCILAEEIGHHFTCGLNLIAFAQKQRTYTSLITEKLERQALYWAAQELIPWPELCGAVLDDRLFSCHELADYFIVTENFMQVCIDLYNEKIPRKMAAINKALMA